MTDSVIPWAFLLFQIRSTPMLSNVIESFFTYSIIHTGLMFDCAVNSLYEILVLI
jgi:hypothetical protein